MDTGEHESDIQPELKLYFSDYFDVDESIVEQYGAFNISLITDLPLFVDPFLLFNSEKEEYQALHDEIIDYLGFLHQLSVKGEVSQGLIKQLYRFQEIPQNWLGYSGFGNSGRGLGIKFANALHKNLGTVLSNFGSEQLTKASHLEKLTLVEDGVGRDSISDFTTNLIFKYLLEYTQTFAKTHLKPEQRKVFRIPRVEFNSKTQSWAEKSYELPLYRNGDKDDFVLLTPEDILSKDDNWINRSDLINGFDRIPNSISNEELRAKVNHYFNSVLPKDPSKSEKKDAFRKTLREFPELYDYYINDREERGDEATAISSVQVESSKLLYVDKFRKLPELLASSTEFYKVIPNSFEDAYTRVLYLKQVIENNDGYKIFWKGTELLIAREDDVHVLYQLTWFLTLSDVNHEVNNGRGPADFKVSRGAVDKSLVEFKLASNSKLKQNLAKQLEVYEAANQTNKSVKVIFYFTESEKLRVEAILKELGLEGAENVVLIDARCDNKPSASNAK